MRQLVPGSEVAGYRIESLVGRGGMGVVYRALQLRLERIVALKVIAPELLDDEGVRERFLAEARAAASVDHPNVIPVHEAGEDDGVAFIAMRFVAGDDLRSLVRGGGALDPAEAGGIVAQAAAALDAIHRAGFVHRDVKPANLLVDPGGHVYLTDFGLAKQVITRSGGTRTGHWVGTLDYVAPEQIRGGRIDARADVYALGGVLHYALTGRVPFEREGDEAKLWAQLSAPPPVPSELRRGLRPEFDAVGGARDGQGRRASATRRPATSAARRAPRRPERSRRSPSGSWRAAPPPRARRRPSPGSRRRPRPAPRTPRRRSDGRRVRAAAPPRRRPVAATAGATVPERRRRRRAPLLAAGALALASSRSSRSCWRAATIRRRPRRRRPRRRRPRPPRRRRATVGKTIENVSDRPNGIALAGGDLWISSAAAAVPDPRRAATGRERAKHPKVGGEVTAIVAYRGDVWVAVGTEREMLRLDGRTGAVRTRFRVPARPQRLAVARSGVWVATEPVLGGPGQLLRYDLAGGAPRQTITVNEGVGGLLAAAGAIWVVKDRARKVARLEPGASRADRLGDAARAAPSRCATARASCG